MFEGLATIMAMSGAFFIFSLLGGKKKTAKKKKTSRRRVTRRKTTKRKTTKKKK